MRFRAERRLRASGELAELLRLSAQTIRSGAASDPASFSRRSVVAWGERWSVHWHQLGLDVYLA
jgi:hypothetical protein